MCDVRVSAIPGRTSDLLSSFSRWPAERLSVREILDALGDRAYALLIVLLGLPNCLPMPPPIPLICGLLLVAVAVQLLVGLSRPWLPRALLDRSIEKSLVEAATRRALPWLERIERVSRPRFVVLQKSFALRIVGVAVLAMALGLLVAAPFVGQIPIGIGVCLVGLGLVERDGYIVAAGTVVGALGLALSAGFAYAILRGVMALFVA